MQLNACRGADHGADPAGHCEGDHSDCAAYDKSSCEAESNALGCTWVLDGDDPAGSCNDATKTTPEGCAGLYDHDGDAATDEIDRVWTADGSHGERGCFADYIRVYV